ncbi:MAG: hypothetical protein HY354_06445 [Planctomycetes bacterium]|nr:hypothetical protein [Planctomycetota bacterium]
MALFWLNVWYDYYDNKRKRRLKPLKEIHEGYYWLVTHVEPYREMLWVLPVDYELGAPTLYRKVPKSVQIAVKELYERVKLEDLFWPRSNISGLFKWHIDKLSKEHLHTIDGKPITCMADVKKLWEYLKLKPNDGAFLSLVILNTLEDYLSSEHLENLKKLSDC